MPTLLPPQTRHKCFIVNHQPVNVKHRDVQLDRIHKFLANVNHLTGKFRKFVRCVWFRTKPEENRNIPTFSSRNNRRNFPLCGKPSWPLRSSRSRKLTIEIFQAIPNHYPDRRFSSDDHSPRQFRPISKPHTLYS